MRDPHAGVTKLNWAGSSRSGKFAVLFAFTLLSAAADAFEVGGTFDVAIQLQNGATCGTTGRDDLAKVVCQSGAYRFTAYLLKDELSLTGDGYVGTGSSTAYRLVRLSGRQYIEMTVGW